MPNRLGRAVRPWSRFLVIRIAGTRPVATVVSRRPRAVGRATVRDPTVDPRAGSSRKLRAIIKRRAARTRLVTGRTRQATGERLPGTSGKGLPVINRIRPVIGKRPRATSRKARDITGRKHLVTGRTALDRISHATWPLPVPGAAVAVIVHPGMIEVVVAVSRATRDPPGAVAKAAADAIGK